MYILYLRETMSITRLIVFNGYYDIGCALCLMGVFSIPVMNDLHRDMFEGPLGDMETRLLATWIFMYGSVRALYGDHSNRHMVVVSYLLEALFCFHEALVSHTMRVDKGLGVMAVSLVFAYMVHNHKS